jgi:hypothetical protein
MSSEYVLVEGSYVWQSVTLISYANNQALVQFAEDFLVKDGLHSLEYDVNRCLAYDRSGCSPLPALMFFSMVDLLGALYAGDARGGGDTAINSKNYTVNLMVYA